MRFRAAFKSLGVFEHSLLHGTPFQNFQKCTRTSKSFAAGSDCESRTWLTIFVKTAGKSEIQSEFLANSFLEYQQRRLRISILIGRGVKITKINVFAHGRSRTIKYYGGVFTFSLIFFSLLPYFAIIRGFSRFSQTKLSLPIQKLSPEYIRRFSSRNCELHSS